MLTLSGNLHCWNLQHYRCLKCEFTGKRCQTLFCMRVTLFLVRRWYPVTFTLSDCCVPRDRTVPALLARLWNISHHHRRRFGRFSNQCEYDGSVVRQRTQTALDVMFEGHPRHSNARFSGHWCSMGALVDRGNGYGRNVVDFNLKNYVTIWHFTQFSNKLRIFHHMCTHWVFMAFVY